MLLIGFWSGRKIKDTTDFLIAGRRLGLVLATATMFATWFGGESVIGTAGTVYKQGLYGIISDPFGANLALILAGLFYAPALRRLNLLTVTDIFEKFYSRELEILATILMIPVYIAWLGAQVVATGLTFRTFTNIDPNLGMLIGGGVIVVYTLCGGMWAVTLTDFVQMLILILGIITILPFVLTDAGGIKNVISSTPKEFFIIFPQTKDLPTWLTYFGKWAMLGLGCVVGQDLIQRSLSSKTESIARWSSVFAGIIYFLIGLVIISIRFISKVCNNKFRIFRDVNPNTCKQISLRCTPIFVWFIYLWTTCSNNEFSRQFSFSSNIVVYKQSHYKKLSKNFTKDIFVNKQSCNCCYNILSSNDCTLCETGIQLNGEQLGDIVCFTFCTYFGSIIF